MLLCLLPAECHRAAAPCLRCFVGSLWRWLHSSPFSSPAFFFWSFFLTDLLHLSLCGLIPHQRFRARFKACKMGSGQWLPASPLAGRQCIHPKPTYRFILYPTGVWRHRCFIKRQWAAPRSFFLLKHLSKLLFSCSRGNLLCPVAWKKRKRSWAGFNYCRPEVTNLPSCYVLLICTAPKRTTTGIPPTIVLAMQHVTTASYFMASL